MPIQFRDVAYLYFEIAEAITNGVSVSIAEAERAVSAKATIDFLDHFGELDLDRFTAADRKALNEAFYHHRSDADSVHVSGNGLRYAAAICVVLLEQGNWVIPNTDFQIDVPHLEFKS